MSVLLKRSVFWVAFLFSVIKYWPKPRKEFIWLKGYNPSLGKPGQEGFQGRSLRQHHGGMLLPGLLQLSFLYSPRLTASSGLGTATSGSQRYASRPIWWLQFSIGILLKCVKWTTEANSDWRSTPLTHEHITLSRNLSLLVPQDLLLLKYEIQHTFKRTLFKNFSSLKTQCLFQNRVF